MGDLVILGQTSRSTPDMPIGLGCQGCGILGLCGGITDFDCYADCCNNPKDCRIACPKAERWIEAVRDAGGVEMKERYAINQQEESLPAYIPHIYHGTGRSKPLACSYAALTTFNVTLPRGQRRFSSPSDLRQYFRIAENAKILLLSIGKDHRLELHWKHSAARQLAEYLASLNISHITAPNFSFAINDPRAEHLVNRSRSLTEAERLTAAGLSVIPHVNAFTQRDWHCWRDFFKNHPHLRTVSQEFQTGLAKRKQATWHIQQLLNIQDALGHGFRLVAVGGRQHLSLLIKLSNVTIVDANPYLKTQYRQKLVRRIWVKRATKEGELLDELMQMNLKSYMKEIEAQFLMARLDASNGSMTAKPHVASQNGTGRLKGLQLPLWNPAHKSESAGT